MKKNLKKAQLALAVAVALTAGFGAAGIASADTTTYTPVYGQVNAGDGSSLAIGSTYENHQTTSATAKNATAIGRGVQATAAQALALGFNTFASGASSIAQGDGANALASDSIAIGKNSNVNDAASSSLAIGNDAKVLEKSTTTITKTKKNEDGSTTQIQETTDSTNSLAIGSAAQTAGETSAAIGYNAQADGKNALAVGKSAKASGESTTAVGVNTQVTAAHGTALGDAANVSGENGVAIGFYSKAYATSSTAIGHYAEVNENATYAVALGYNSKVTADDGNVISIGNSGLNRKIIHVAQGTADTDAVNLSQVITDITYDATSGKLSFKTGANKTETWSATIAPKVDTTVDGTAGTYNALTDTQLNNFNNSVNALQDRIKALEDAKQQGTTGGVDATGDVTSGETNAVSGGNLYSELRPEDGTYVQKDNTTAGNLTALDAAVKANADAIGTDDDYGTAFNNISKITEETVTGDDGSITTATHPTTLKENIGALDAAIGKAEDLGTILDKDGNALNTYKDEDGDTKDTSVVDAVKTVNDKVGDLATDGNYITAGKSVNDNLSALDDQVFTNTNDIARLGDRLNKVGAGAAALAALHVEDFDADNKLSFAAGFGHYKNANAGAIGAFYKPNHDTTFSVASTVGNGDAMLNAGVSFKLGKSAHVEKTMVAKADYEALQNKVAAQDQKLAAQDERLASQDAQIEELKAQVAALVAKG